MRLNTYKTNSMLEDAATIDDNIVVNTGVART